MEILNYIFSSWIYIGFLGVMWAQGLCLGYILWAQETPFKRSFTDALAFKWLWGSMDRKK